jgi:hypothetical protein
VGVDACKAAKEPTRLSEQVASSERSREQKLCVEDRSGDRSTALGARKETG